MIPTIEAIVEQLVAGKITKSQAVTWLHMHAEDAARELRDDFAAHALAGSRWEIDNQHAAEKAYALADAMLKEREKNDDR